MTPVARAFPWARIVLKQWDGADATGNSTFSVFEQRGILFGIVGGRKPEWDAKSRRDLFTDGLGEHRSVGSDSTMAGAPGGSMRTASVRSCVR